MSETRTSTEELIAAALGDLGERVEPARQFAIPKINYDRFGARTADIKEYCQNIVEWLSLPYRYDRFGADHNSRRAWIESLQTQFGPAAKPTLDAIAKNKFRSNLAVVTTMSAMITMWLGEMPDIQPLAAKLKKINRLQETVARGLKIAGEQEIEERKTQLMYLEDLSALFLRELAAWSEKPAK